MAFAIWALIVGALLVAMALAGSLLRRLPLSASMFYLGVGWTIGPAGWGLLNADPLEHSGTLETITEIAVLLSLFSVGLRLGLPLSSPRWWLPVRLASASMVLTVAGIAAVGTLGLGLPLGAAVLLGAVLAPTDPVLASDVQVERTGDVDRLRFSLTGEGGLNDGTAFPFVMLGLGLLGLRELGTLGWRWVTLDVLWAIAGGLLIGASLGMLVGRLVVYLRTQHREAVGLDEFLVLGLIGLAAGAAQLAQTYGFLAVFAAAVAMQRVTEPSPRAAARELPPTGLQEAPGSEEAATHPEHAGAHMMRAVRGFNAQLERVGEVAVILAVGAMLPHARLDAVTGMFLLLLFLVIRPLAVWLGLLGAPVRREQRVLISWFGIRGVGSIYYLMFAVHRGVPGPLARELIGITLTTVAVSIVLHGVSVTPLMYAYAARKAGRVPGASSSAARR
jgi:NhaP-type Na+/H+ or K+/H+ antiporter